MTETRRTNLDASWLLPKEQAITRHPGDVLRIVVGTTVLLVAVPATRGRIGPSETALFQVINALPDAITVPLRFIMQAGSYPAVIVAAGAAALAGRRRLARDLAVGGTVGWVLARVAKLMVARGRPGLFLEEIIFRGEVASGLGFPSGHTTVAGALATAAGPYLNRGGRRFAWTGVWLVGLGRVYFGVHLPLDIVGGASLGWIIGAALHLVFGAPRGHGSRDAIRRALGDSGLTPTSVELADVDARGSVPFFAEVEDGPDLFIKTLGRNQRNADMLFKLWRYLVFRGMEGEAPFATPKEQVEHEADVTLLAQRAGVSTPRILFTTRLDDGTAMLVQQRIDARSLDTLTADELDDGLLRGIWEQVRRLREIRIAHRDLRGANVLVDDRGRPWLIDFGFASAGASDRGLALDVAEMLVSLSALVGPERAVAAALDVLGSEPVVQALPVLQPLTLSSVARRTLRENPELANAIQEEVTAATHLPPAPTEPVTRVQLKKILGLIAGALAVHLLLPQVGELRQTLAVLTDLHWPWLALGAVGAAATHVLAAISQIGAVDRPLSLRQTTVAQLAAGFANRFGPPGVGNMAVMTRYLERTGYERRQAFGAVALKMAAGSVVHTVLLFIALSLIGEAGIVPLHRLPSDWRILVAVVAVLAVLGLVLWSPLGRRRVVTPVIDAARNIVAVLREPDRAVKLLGGAAGVIVAYTLTLAVCLWAFEAQASLLDVAVAYLGGMTVGSLAPTPGGLGAVEAALVAGLTVVGVETGAAVAGVLAFRLLTFWLPILPGVLAFRYLRARQLL